MRVWCTPDLILSGKHKKTNFQNHIVSSINLPPAFWPLFTFLCHCVVAQLLLSRVSVIRLTVRYFMVNRKWLPLNSLQSYKSHWTRDVHFLGISLKVSLLKKYNESLNNFRNIFEIYNFCIFVPNNLIKKLV